MLSVPGIKRMTFLSICNAIQGIQGYSAIRQIAPSGLHETDHKDISQPPSYVKSRASPGKYTYVILQEILRMLRKKQHPSDNQDLLH